MEESFEKVMKSIQAEEHLDIKLQKSDLLQSEQKLF